MKALIRYQCDFCKRYFARPETAIKHEAECVSNPEGVNCFRCDHCKFDDWHDDYGHRHGDHPVCDIREESAYTLKQCAGGHKSYAPRCDDFKQREDTQ